MYYLKICATIAESVLEPKGNLDMKLILPTLALAMLASTASAGTMTCFGDAASTPVTAPLAMWSEMAETDPSAKNNPFKELANVVDNMRDAVVAGLNVAVDDLVVTPVLGECGDTLRVEGMTGPKT